MGVREDIKSIIAKSGWTMSRLVEALNEKYDRAGSVQSFSNKLKRGTIKYREAQEIAEVLGYSIEWVRKED